MDPVLALRRCGGVATWRRLRARDVSWHALRSVTVSSGVQRLRRGAYALPDADPALVEAVRVGAVLSCTSAAAHHGMSVLVPRGVHVTVARGQYRTDRRRANALAARGMVLLRFSYEDIVHRPQFVVAMIRQALERRAA